MSAWTHDICFGQPTKDPQKKRWIKIGGIFENDKGQLSLKIDTMPGIPPEGLWLNVFPKKPKDQDQGNQVQDEEQWP